MRCGGKPGHGVQGGPASGWCVHDTNQVINGVHSVIKHTRDRCGASRSSFRGSAKWPMWRYLQGVSAALVLGLTPGAHAHSSTPDRPAAQLQERVAQADELSPEVVAAAAAVAEQAVEQAEIEAAAAGAQAPEVAQLESELQEQVQAEGQSEGQPQAQAPSAASDAQAVLAAQQAETAALLATLEDEADPAVLRKKLEMLARKVGELQARLMQLDLLGDQLADLAGVPAEEYRVDPPAAQGGPMIEAAPISFRQLEDEVISLEMRLAQREDHLSVLDARLTDLVAHLELTPSRMPIEGYRYRSSSFGPRFDPINGRRAFHEGLDFSAPRGTPILAAAGGVVVTARYLRGFGNTVEIDHGDQLLTRYAHAAKLLVKPGQVVQRGQKIATVGSTGRSTGPHLHFEVRLEGNAIDPRLYLAGSGDPVLQALASRP